MVGEIGDEGSFPHEGEIALWRDSNSCVNVSSYDSILLAHSSRSKDFLD